MPTQATYPGVYIEERPPAARPITGVATSITAFVGRTRRGPVDEPAFIDSFADYARRFGGLWRASTMSYAVQQFFLNGGRQAVVVRCFRADGGAGVAGGSLPADDGALALAAASPGAWGNHLTATVDHDTADPADVEAFNLTVVDNAGGGAATTETFRNVSIDDGSPRFLPVVLASSELVVVADAMPAARPDAASVEFGGGDDGAALTDAVISGADAARSGTGIWALEKADRFNLLCIPPLSFDVDVGDTTRARTAEYCRTRRAFYVVDPPATWTSAAAAAEGVSRLGLGAAVAAVYFPRIHAPDPEREGRIGVFAPCGMVAGVIARTDAERGVWKAPAGTDAVLRGARGLEVALTDGETGRLNPLGINCLRTMPAAGIVVWGARTLRGADRLGDQWKYVAVRRTADFIEESLYRGLQWVVFEPNDEPLWAQIRLDLGAFMQRLFRQGAFQGSSPREAYLVKCDAETTTQADIDRGIVNIVVGFAPLKPAEFVFVEIHQLAGQHQS